MEIQQITSNTRQTFRKQTRTFECRQKKTVAQINTCRAIWTFWAWFIRFEDIFNKIFWIILFHFSVCYCAGYFLDSQQVAICDVQRNIYLRKVMDKPFWIFPYLGNDVLSSSIRLQTSIKPKNHCGDPSAKCNFSLPTIKRVNEWTRLGIRKIKVNVSMKTMETILSIWGLLLFLPVAVNILKQIKYF